MKQIRSIFVVQVRQVGAKLTLACSLILTCAEDVNIQQLNFHKCNLGGQSILAKVCL